MIEEKDAMEAEAQHNLFLVQMYQYQQIMDGSEKDGLRLLLGWRRTWNTGAIRCKGSSKEATLDDANLKRWYQDVWSSIREFPKQLCWHSLWQATSSYDWYWWSYQYHQDVCRNICQQFVFVLLCVTSLCHCYYNIFVAAFVETQIKWTFLTSNLMCHLTSGLPTKSASKF